MDFRTRLEQGRERRVEGEATAEPEENFACEYFATDRVKTYPPCLELRFSQGARKALPYSYVTEMGFDNEAGIEICTNSKKITITGRNLYKLFDCLISYRVRYIQAHIGNDTNEDGLFVKSIFIEEIIQ